VLGGLMADRLARRAQPLPELLVPVPLHPGRLRQRGYNQALEIGRALVQTLAIELAPQAARRVHPTLEQTTLTAAQRLRNLRGAFEVSGRVRDRHVAILDDVITTGATAGELARTAWAAGAREVEIWAAARALLRT
jgi:ComF family protein